jgi:uncharacterized protein (TIGR03086 family)
MDDLRARHRRAIDGFGERVHAVGPDQWDRPTPCGEWDVRALVNHLVVEQLWVPPLLDGLGIDEIGDRFDGDQLGGDPVEAWDAAAGAALAAFAAPDALEAEVELSYGSQPAPAYLREMTADALVHTWDLARGIGADDTLDPELVELALAWVEDRADELQASGLFDPPVPVPDDADAQTRLLAALGRRS